MMLYRKGTYLQQKKKIPEKKGRVFNNIKTK